MKAQIAALLLAGLLSAAGCGPRPPDAQAQIRTAVAATLAALPAPTANPLPLLPTPAPAELAGLFCEYQFCIGHPPDISFFDVSGQRNPTATSSYSQGILIGYNAKLFVQFMWQDAPGMSDPQFMLDLIVDARIDTRSGSLDPQVLGDLNVFYQPITSSASALLPAGGAAAWMCGGRAFAWKAYTSDPDSARSLFNDAMRKFRCNR
jgi:hypothetical protein